MTVPTSVPGHKLLLDLKVSMIGKSRKSGGGDNAARDLTKVLRGILLSSVNFLSSSWCLDLDKVFVHPCNLWNNKRFNFQFWLAG